MRISEIQDGTELGDEPIYVADFDDSEFLAQMAASNAEIAVTKYDLQNLFTKASAFCKNSGLGATDHKLTETPPRYSGEGLSSMRLGSTYRSKTGYFRSTPPRKLP